MSAPLSPAQRLQLALSHREADRVPFLLPVILQGARELSLGIRDYFASAEAVAEGQLRLQARYRHDGLIGFFYSSQEIEAFGGETIFIPDGPPNSGEPVLRSARHIDRLKAPRIEDCPTLRRVLQTIRLLRKRAGDQVPVLGAVISPFSLPVMQLGFEAYLLLLHEDPERFESLMRVNEQFTVAWANAQLEAGASAITYADPMSSPTIVPKEMYLRTGHLVARRTLAGIRGPCAASFASGRVLPIVEEVALSGAVAVGASALEDLAALKNSCRGRLAVIGNLNALQMRRWTPAEAEARVKEAIAQAGPGGGFVLSDNHGEIPWQVPAEVLQALSEAVQRWGRYPLDWVSRGA